MPPSATARRWMLVFLIPVLAVLAPSIRSQKLLPREVDVHLRPAIEELNRTRGLDRATLEHVREAFHSSDGTWNKERVTNRLAAAIARKEFGLSSDRKGFKILQKPATDPNPRLVLRTSGRFVESVSSVIRRLSILEEIGPGTSTKLGQDQLRVYLKDTVKVTDYQQVTEAFHPDLIAEAVTLKEPKTLLRLYGGKVQASGRYFFCCLQRSPVGQAQAGERPAQFWSDASGLATPPENLGRHLAVTTIPAGTTVIIGTVADNFVDQSGRPKLGGNTQIFVPHIRTFPFQEYRLAGEKSAVTEILLQSDDRILRFRK